ncbi:hypothetical protein BH10PSE18_BH10PSE18_15070 [soil metagenome]
MRHQIRRVKTIAEIRRARLDTLINESGSIAELNEKLGWPRTDPRLTRIRNANIRQDRGTPFQMGDAMARDIETALGLEAGWMDNLPLYDDPAVSERMKILQRVAEELKPWQVDQLIKIGTALSEPAEGTNGVSGK